MKVYSAALGTEVFVLHKENADIARGKSKAVPGTNQGCISLFLLLAIVTVALLGIAGYRATRGAQLAASRTMAQGTVISKRIVLDSYDNPIHWFVAYVFSIPDKTQYKHEDEITQAAYDELKEGSHVTVRYAAADPNNASLSEITTVSDDLPWFVAAIGFLIFLLLMAPLASAIRRRHTKLRGGRLMLGTVTTVKTEDDSDNDQVLTIGYELRLPYETTERGDDHAIRSDLEPADLPVIGTPLAIWYAAGVKPIIL